MKQLEEFPRHGNQAYDWDTLLNGQVWLLEKGVDFQSQPSSVRSLALGQARKRGGTVRTSINKGDGNVTLQFLIKDQQLEQIELDTDVANQED